MRCKLSLLAIVVALAIPLAVAQNNRGTQNPFHWTGSLAAGKTLAIKNVSGEITVDAAPGTQVEVTATKHGDGANRIRIVTAPSSEGIAICAIFPSGDGGDASSCDASSNWSVHSHGEGDNARVDFVVHMPRDVRLTVRDVNGSVKATGLGEFAEASTVNGSVEVETAQWARLSTVNGSIDGRFGRGDWSEPLSIHTVNGDVNLTLPADFGADVEFNAVNGDFESDLPVEIKSRDAAHGPKHIRATVGGGGRELSIHTVNGSAHLRRG
jgi:hypothetical protein